MKIHLKNLRLRTIIGIKEDERKARQDVIINAMIYFDGKRAAVTDNIEDTVNYKTLTKSIIKKVENNSFNLLEKLSQEVLELILEIKGVEKAEIEISKPHALRYSDSISIITSGRNQ